MNVRIPIAVLLGVAMMFGTLAGGEALARPTMPGEKGGLVEKEPANLTCLYEEWELLLNLSLDRTDESRRVIERFERTAPEPLSKLAALLMEEWDLDPAEQRLKRPKVVWRPDPGLEGLSTENRHVLRPYVLIKVEVMPSGRPRGLSLLTSSGNDQVDQLLLDASAEVLYRPARSQDGFTTTESILQWHLTVR